MCLFGIFIPEEYLSEGRHGTPRVVYIMKGSGSGNRDHNNFTSKANMELEDKLPDDKGLAVDEWTFF